MNKAMIDGKLNFIIPLEDDEGNTHKIFIPYIPKNNFDDIAPVLGELFTNFQKGLNPDVFIIDYKMHLKNIYDRLNIEDIDYSFKIDAFLDRVLLGAKVLSNEGEILDYLDFSKNYKDLADQTRAFVLFISALYRYLTASKRKAAIGHLVTFKSFSEWAGLHKKSSPEQKNLDIKERTPLTSIEVMK